MESNFKSGGNPVLGQITKGAQAHTGGFVAGPHSSTTAQEGQYENEKEMNNLDLRLRTFEPISHNIYRVHVPLKPQEHGSETFLGREDIRDDLNRRILTSGYMPTFFLQGQRRVGKTKSGGGAGSDH